MSSRIEEREREQGVLFSQTFSRKEQYHIYQLNFHLHMRKKPVTERERESIPLFEAQ